MADLAAVLATVRDRIVRYQGQGIGEQDTKATLIVPTVYESPHNAALEIVGLNLTGGGFFLDRTLQGSVVNRGTATYEAIDVFGSLYGPADGGTGDTPVSKQEVTLRGLKPGASVPFEIALVASGRAAKEPRYSAAITRTRQKGHSTYATAVLPQAAVTNGPASVPDQAPTTKTCPDCAETVLEAARICRFCRHEFLGTTKV